MYVYTCITGMVHKTRSTVAVLWRWTQTASIRRQRNLCARSQVWLNSVNRMVCHFVNRKGDFPQKYSIICWRGILKVNACLVHRRDQMTMTVEQRGQLNNVILNVCVFVKMKVTIQWHTCIYFFSCVYYPSQQGWRGYINATTGTLLILGQRSRSNLALCLWNLVGTIQTTVFANLLYNFTCTCKLLVVGDVRLMIEKNPTDIGSGGHMTRLTLAPLWGMPHFALSSLYFNAPWLETGAD